MIQRCLLKEDGKNNKSHCPFKNVTSFNLIHVIVHFIEKRFKGAVTPTSVGRFDFRTRRGLATTPHIPYFITHAVLVRENNGKNNKTPLGRLFVL